MENDTHKSGLYRWQKQSKPRVQSRSQRVTSSNDIQDWIKKVEEASTKATDVAFGLTPDHGVTGKQKGKMAAQQKSDLVRYHESAFSEAQQLLSQWVTDKIHFDDDDGYDDLEAWRRARANRLAATASEKSKDDDNDFSLERLTRLAMDDNFEVDEAAIYARVKRNAVGDTDPYANLYEMEENDAVDSVLKNMMSKQLVKDDFKKKIGFDEEAPPDPRTKMEVRHQMVKNNREKRQKEEEKRRLETKRKKDARLEAQQIILKEQKDRDMRSKLEDQQLKKDMAKIRKEMYDDRRKKEDDIRRKREEKEALDKLARIELARQTTVEMNEKILSNKLESDRRKKQLIQREMISARITSLNLQCMHRHFTAWYDLVLSRRLLMGKVKAMSDWKLMLRVWGAWRSHIRGRQIDIETEKHERNIIEAERHRLIADRHFSYTVLRRCMYAWQRFATESAQKKELEEEQQKTKNKMAALLSAVAEGKLEGGNSHMAGDNTARSSLSTGRKSNCASQPSVSARSAQSAKSRNQVVQNLRQAGKQQMQGVNNKELNDNHKLSNNSKMSNNPSNLDEGKTETQTSCRSTVVPTEPWQVTRKHLNLTKEQIAQLGTQQDGEEQNAHTDAQIRKRQGTQPWMSRQMVPNNFEHRYTAQQAALKEQQAQIKEQRQLIEQLQHEQRKQTLKQRHSPDSNTHIPEMTRSEPQDKGPPEGWHIPRDTEDLGDNNNSFGEAHITHPSKHTPPKGLTQKLTSAHHDSTVPRGMNVTNNDHDAWSPTERSGSVTERSDFTSATSATTTTQNTKYIKVLKNMEERAAERARLKAIRDERRKIQEEEKAAKILAEEEERLRQIDEEKKAKAEAYRQKKRLEKQREEEKQRVLIREQELNEKAETHYIRAILKYRGLLPFKKLVSLSKRNWLKAVRFHEKSILRQCLQDWKHYTEEEMATRNKIADQMNEFILTKKCFLNWRHYKYHQHFLERRAEKHYNATLKCKTFNAWVENIKEEKLEMEQLMDDAGKTYIRNLVKKCFVGWRDLPQKLKREEEKHKRKLELRKRVSELIPDFAPSQSVVDVNRSKDSVATDSKSFT